MPPAKSSIGQRIDKYSKNKSWLPRFLVLLFFLFLLSKILKTPDFSVHRNNPVDLLDFGIHELGHMLFIPFGEFMHILGGSLFQCLFAATWLGICIKRGWYFAACMCLCWLGMNFIDVAIYAGDAKDRVLTLSCLGDDYYQCHDWYQILTRLHHLEWYSGISHALRASGILSMAAGLLAGTVLIFKIIYSSLVKREETV